MTEYYEKYEIVSGLEIHVELLTKTKLFCGCRAGFGDAPNSNTCPVCAGLPGSLPVLNKEAVRMAVMLGLALNCDISQETHFDRKNYFYPDNPQNYQITQLYSPICQNGQVELASGKQILIKEMHLEDDAGKLIHEDEKTCIDYNRSGVPLIEIVTQADFSDSDEVVEFLKLLIGILKELEICDCKMQEGSLRVDVNLSVRPVGDKLLGVRSEVKNINSFTEIKHAMDYEKRRHVDLLEAGNVLCQDTRGWNEQQRKSFFMREKENERDYRYFPEPDLPCLIISQEDIAGVRKNMPMLPAEKKKYIIDKYKIGIKETEFLCRDKKIFKLFEAVTDINSMPEINLKWLQGECSYLVNQQNGDWSKVYINPENLAMLIKLSEEKSITMQTAKELLEKLFESDFDVEAYIKEHNLSLNSDKDLLLEVAMKVIKENEKSVNDYFAGRDRALQYLIGQGMKHLKGRADVSLLTECLKKQLEEVKNS